MRVYLSEILKSFKFDDLSFDLGIFGFAGVARKLGWKCFDVAWIWIKCDFRNYFDFFPHSIFSALKGQSNNFEKIFSIRSGNRNLRVFFFCKMSIWNLIHSELFPKCNFSVLRLRKGPFKYYVSKKVGGWGQKMAIFAIYYYFTIYADVGGWA